MRNLFQSEAKILPKKPFLKARTVDRVVRVLMYPNLTFKELEKDSYVDVLRSHIRELTELSPNYWFYVLLPRKLDLGPNVTHLEYTVPTYAPMMRVHFDALAFKAVIAKLPTIDVVYSHLPEHTHQLCTVIQQHYGYDPKIVGYCHCFDFLGVVGQNRDSLGPNVNGLLKMQKCFINTHVQKKRVLEVAKKLFNTGVIKALDQIIDVIPPAHAPLAAGRNSPKKIIVFNHRPERIRHFDEFMSTVDALWKKRKDFKVWVPLLAKPNRPFVFTDKFDKQGYYKYLTNCLVGYSPQQGFAGWSVATVDGLSRGCPYIMYDADYYREINPKADFFKTEADAVKLLNRYLDDMPYRNRMSLLGVRAVKDVDSSVNRLHKEIMLASRSKPVSQTDGLSRLKAIIRKRGSIKEADLLKEIGWGKQMAFLKYRTALHADKCVGEVYGAEPIYVWRGK
jgi:hypothetical protein